MILYIVYIFREYADAGASDSDDECSYAAFKREQETRKAANDFIQKQFALRKNPQVSGRASFTVTCKIFYHRIFV